MTQKAFILLIFLKFSSPQLLHQSEINARLSDACDGRIYQEKRISKTLLDFSKQLQNCSSILKSSNIAKDVVTSLDNFDTLVQQLMTVNNFQLYENISDCGDINFKIIMLDFEQRKLICIRDKITFNTTLIYRQYNDLLNSYRLNLNSLVFLSSNERMVWSVITGVQNVLTNYWNYLRILAVDTGNLAYYNSILTAFKRFYCQCLAKVAWNGFNSTLEANVQVIEKQLVIEQSRIFNLSSTAQTRVKSAISLTSSPMSAKLQLVQTTLTNILSLSDYPNITWSNIKNCNDAQIRIKFLISKQFQYTQILSTASIMNTYLTIYQINVNATSINGLSSTQIQAVSTAVNSIIAVRNRFRFYLSRLIYSIGKMSKMITDFSFIGDTHCTCDLPATTTIPASTSTSTRTLTERSTSTTKVPTTTLTTQTTTSTSTTRDPTTTTSTAEIKTSTSTTGKTTSTSTTKDPIATSTTETTTSTSTTKISTMTSTTETTSTTIDLKIPTTSSTSVLAITTTTLPTTITSTIATTTTTPTPCGTLFDLATNNPSDSATPGLLSGVYTDGSPVYPGIGNFSTFSNLQIPASIVQSPTKTYAPGAYCSFGGHHYDNKRAFYFFAHPNLKWIATDATKADKVPGVIHVRDFHPCLLYVSRHNFTYGGIQVNPLGFYYANVSYSYYWSGAASTLSNVNFEVLACQP